MPSKHLLSLFLLALSISINAEAQSFRVPSVNEGRAGMWDFTFQISTNESKTYGGEQGSNLNLKQRTGFGFGGVYNLNEHFGLGLDLNFSSPRYTATIQPVDLDQEPIVIDHRANIATGQLKGVWNILKSSFTPYVEGGGGFTFIDSNVVDSEAPTFCWYDPWYGTMCNTSSYSDTNFSYGGAAGFRWDTKNSMVLKLSINTLIIDTSNDPTINSIRFEIGARY
jgi:opacity protein-like surface antigen